MASSLKTLPEKVVFIGLLLGLSPACYVDGVALVGNPRLSEGFAEEDTGEDPEHGGEGQEDGQDSSAGTGGEGGSGDTGDGDAEAQDACRPIGELDAPPSCAAQAPSDTFDPVVKWTWSGEGERNSVIVTPLVANLSDDNGDQNVDLCDRPDVLVVAVDLPEAKSAPLPPGYIYIVDSESGQTQLSFDLPVDPESTPVLADLDADGEVELLALQRGEDLGGPAGERRVVALERDGSIAWESEAWFALEHGGSLSVADLDADGSPEILAPNHVLSAEGTVLWQPLDNPEGESIPVAVDLDLDGTLEVLFGRTAYDFSGAELFVMDVPGNKSAGIPAVANFDADPYPELYIQANQHLVFEHDGTPKGTCAVSNKSLPVAIVDSDQNGSAEVLLQRGANLYSYEVSVIGEADEGFYDERSIVCEERWSGKITTDERWAGTSFDFLADGSAEALFLDSESVKIFSDSGELVAQIERRARASTALPVIADADNDGAAELLVVGSEPEGGDLLNHHRPALMLIQNADDRFAPTRRIWNQHAYHVTNVREDGTVPAEELPHWLQDNSFRNNPAPDYEGWLCQGQVR